MQIQWKTLPKTETENNCVEKVSKKSPGSSESCLHNKPDTFSVPQICVRAAVLISGALEIADKIMHF